VNGLIIHSDDFGETAEITRGILEGIEASIVTSTTILANMPGTDVAIAEAARRGREASFGVHLNLCEGQPLTNPKSLVGEDGRFHPKRQVALRAVTRRLDPDEIGSELAAQIMKVQEGGVQISHLDSHKHLHQLPGVSRIVANLARRFGIERIRCTLEEGVWVRGLRWSAWASRAVRRRFASQAQRLFSEAGLRHPGRVFDVRELMETQDRSGRLALLRRPYALSEMFCHVGTELADREKPGSCARHAELRFLLSEEFRSLLAEAPIELRSFWDC
jgi:predicted glycoside hydrolase/deacetylase ChbG (UPF0249 family)